jgi:cystathionine beta-synthase
MYDNGFVDATHRRRTKINAWWAKKRIGDLDLQSPITITPDVTCREAIDVMSSQGFDMVPIQSESDGKVLGVLTEGNLTAMITQGRIDADSACIGAMYKQFHQVGLQHTLADLTTIFDKDSYALVVAEQKCFRKGDNEGATGVSGVSSRSVVAGVVTRIDLLNYITKYSDRQSTNKPATDTDSA